ncbi:cation diffusion facilitator family transporter [Acaryochloris marina]|uniref:Cation efflux family protein n=1 Tax=Acaryochloris marina (strain MBIC 11017) TaxID=329726 RepID=B0CEJ9_ACAM1|nr:cation diffusion facilitator family transporter [Acaryochloris marina]ABW26965.1 cation efflux family protein [Acaryochloris marina MBIC11017]BDM81731.1 cation transporter [Acaryochloris marina MBIC10699]
MTAETTAHSHSHHHNHDACNHSHGVIDPSVASSERGLWAVKWSTTGLLTTVLLQLGAVYLSGSVALLADLLHNVGDIISALPLGIAFWLGRLSPNRRFQYGYGRVEDVAGVMIVLIIAASAVATGYESIQRFIHPQALEHLGVVAIAAGIGFIGNEAVALFRIRVGNEIGSAALVADGYHARVDGLVSLAVVISAVGLWLGYAWADPLVGLGITFALIHIVWESGQTVLTRLLDGVEPETTEALQQALAGYDYTHLKARWMGHQLYAQVCLKVDPEMSIGDGDAIASQLRSHLHQEIPYLSDISIEMQAKS